MVINDLERGDRNADLVIILEEALDKAMAIKKKDDSLIFDFQNQILNIQTQNEILSLQNRSLRNQISESENENTRLKNKRFGIGAFAGFGFGMEKIIPAIGAGVTYNFIRF